MLMRKLLTIANFHIQKINKSLHFSFICEDTSTRRQRRDVTGCHLLLSVQPLKGRGNSLCALPKYASELASVCLHTIPLMLNVKKGSC